MNGPRTISIGKLLPTVSDRKVTEAVRSSHGDHIMISTPRLGADGKPEGNRKERRLAAKMLLERAGHGRGGGSAA